MVKKTCKKNQIRNPDTGRCVLKKGKIGKSILAKNRKLEKQDCKHLKTTVTQQKNKVKLAKKKLSTAQSDLKRAQDKWNQCKRNLKKGKNNRKKWNEIEKWAKKFLLSDYISIIMLKVKNDEGYFAYFEPANRREAVWCTGKIREGEEIALCTNQKTLYTDLIRMFSVKNAKIKRKIKTLIQNCEKKRKEFYNSEPERIDLKLMDEADQFFKKAGMVAAKSAGFKRFW